MPKAANDRKSAKKRGDRNAIECGQPSGWWVVGWLGLLGGGNPQKPKTCARVWLSATYT